MLTFISVKQHRRRMALLAIMQPIITVLIIQLIKITSINNIWTVIEIIIVITGIMLAILSIIMTAYIAQFSSMNASASEYRQLGHEYEKEAITNKKNIIKAMAGHQIAQNYYKRSLIYSDMSHQLAVSKLGKLIHKITKPMIQNYDEFKKEEKEILKRDEDNFKNYNKTK